MRTSTTRLPLLLSPMDPDPHSTPPSDLPPDLRFLKRLVTVLTLTMVVGVTLIVVLLTLRLTQPTSPAPALPDQIALPEGTVAEAITLGPGWTGVVTKDGRLLVYDAQGTLLREIEVLPR